MRVVLDTNVLVSGTYWKGDSFCVLELIDQGRIEHITSPEILREYRKTLQTEEISEKVKKKQLLIQSAASRIMRKTIIVRPERKHSIIEEDPDDNKIIDCAVAGKADYIITQDRHLLRLGSFLCIAIVTPGQFLTDIQL